MLITSLYAPPADFSNERNKPKNSSHHEEEKFPHLFFHWRRSFNVADLIENEKRVGGLTNETKNHISSFLGQSETDDTTVNQRIGQ
jgi:hypothetical protein